VLHSWALVSAFAYLGILFAIAFYGDKRADSGRSIIANPYIYALSMQSTRRHGPFMAVSAEPPIPGRLSANLHWSHTDAALWWLVLRKMVCISKANRITSIADFIGARYGKSSLLAGIVTIIAVIGVVPYIALQLKAVSNSRHDPVEVSAIELPTTQQLSDVVHDTAFYVAMLLGAFTIVFGTRHLTQPSVTRAWLRLLPLNLCQAIGFSCRRHFRDFWHVRWIWGHLWACAAHPDLRALMTMAAPRGAMAHGSIGHSIDAFDLDLTPTISNQRSGERRRESHCKAVWLFPLICSQSMYLFFRSPLRVASIRRT